MNAIPRVLALDFDGVICDSAAEAARSTWHAIHSLLQRNSAESSQPSPAYETEFVRLRPYIEDAFDLLLLGLACLSGAGERVESEGFSTTTLNFLDEQFEWRNAGLSRDTASHLLGAARDSWLKNDQTQWLSVHTFYPGVIEALKKWELNPNISLHIVTKKVRRFTELLLKHAGISIPSNRMFCAEDGEKISYLRKLREEFQESTIRFVEDRLPTLEKVDADSVLSETLELSLAEWGFITPAHLSTARAHPRIRTISLGEFTVIDQS